MCQIVFLRLTQPPPVNNVPMQHLMPKNIHVAVQVQLLPNTTFACCLGAFLVYLAGLRDHSKVYSRGSANGYVLESMESSIGSCYQPQF